VVCNKCGKEIPGATPGSAITIVTGSHYNGVESVTEAEDFDFCVPCIGRVLRHDRNHDYGAENAEHMKWLAARLRQFAKAAS
jgi:hypothetical protein